jgi:molybdopterin converting factor small subunit
MAKVVIQYVAILREERGLPGEEIDTLAGTPGALYEELRARHGFTLPPGRIRAAVNDEFVPVSTPLRDGDTVVFIPPVAGG